MNASFTKLIFVTMPSNDPAKTSLFYEQLLGIPFGRTFSHISSYHAPILTDGTQFVVQQRFSSHDAPTPYFAVEDMAAAIKLAESTGCKVVTEPMPLTVPLEMQGSFVANAALCFELNPEDFKGTIGIGAVLRDPAENRVGFVQFEKFMHPMYSLGEYAKKFSPVQEKSHRLTVQLGRLFEQLEQRKTTSNVQ